MHTTINKIEKLTITAVNMSLSISSSGIVEIVSVVVSTIVDETVVLLAEFCLAGSGNFLLVECNNFAVVVIFLIFVVN